MESRILTRLSENAALVNAALEGYLTAKDTQYEVLRDAMRYSTLGGGKRIRPFLALEFYRLFAPGGDDRQVLPFACAIEMLHTYSLIHDDLPAMDNDTLRRGRPTNHVVYGEATALLAGDALLTLAFGTAAGNPAVSDTQKAEAVRLLAEKAGVDGMVGGQQLDLIGETTRYSMETLRVMQRLKTGCLIETASQFGLIAAGGYGDEAKRTAVKHYAAGIGLAFQITDDILNVTGDEKVLGKPVHSDDRNHKTTFMTYMTVDEAHRYAKELSDEACAAISAYRGSEILCELASYLVDRRN